MFAIIICSVLCDIHLVAKLVHLYWAKVAAKSRGNAFELLHEEQ